MIPRTELQNPCSRPISRLVRKELEKQVLKPRDKGRMGNWPLGCPFNPEADLYEKHEKSKKKRSGSNGGCTCTVCGKVFKSEHYIDLHLERRHMDIAPSNGTAACLADHCEMFELCGKEEKRKGTYSKKPASVECSNQTMAVARERCTNTMRQCFPLDVPANRDSYARHTREFCQVLDCHIREEHRKALKGDHLPVVVLIVMIIFIFGVVFLLMVSCVDYSDDILSWLRGVGLLSDDTLKTARAARDQGRKAIGFEHHRGV